ncbi:short-chain collagen C4-like [Magallana gigas]|uniref:short-chain collagen C4-like n=1 Tax=Magallana gigas TaxID=29159 RepID=UPI00333F3599
MMVSIFLIIFILQVFAEKRILLNDPALVQSQILALERRMADVVTKNSDLAAKYNDVIGKYNDLFTKYTEQSGKYTDLSTKYNDLSTKYNTLLTKGSAGGIFIRWGRKDCPRNNTESIYSGFAGGSWYDHTGAAAEFVCLPRDPDLITKFTSHCAYMYGSEYDSTEFGHHNGDDLPCSVCRSTVQSSVLMIPGKSSCYGDWSMQYHGYLVAGHYAYKAATQYICLDEHPEALTAGHRNENGKMFYPVEAVCGSLACPPYQNGTYLTCVVCTK